MRIVLILTGCVLLASPLLAVESSVIVLPSKNGKVALNHLKHQKVNKGCRACHQNDVGGPIKELNMNWAHKKCMGCHDTLRRGPHECRECHQKA